MRIRGMKGATVVQWYPRLGSGRTGADAIQVGVRLQIIILNK